jgi:6-phosphogluconolactonase
VERRVSRILLFVGSYGLPASHLASANGNGIATFELNPVTGSLSPIGNTPGVENPSYLAVHPGGTTLYAVNEIWDLVESEIVAYHIQPDGKLTYANKQRTLGGGAAHVSLEPTGRWALVTNYRDGESVATFPLDGDGRLGPARHSVRHEGRGPNAARQESPHAHCAVMHPTNGRVYVCDLGTDRVHVYRFDAEQGRLEPNSQPYVKFEPGSGPRHITFDSSGAWAYVIEELSSTVTVLAVEPETGVLEPVQRLSALPEGVRAGSSFCSAIHLTASDRFLYVGNRGHDSIAMFAVEQASGRLFPLGHQPSGGRNPRDFVIDPTDTFLLAGNQDSDTIVTFRIDPATGLLSETGSMEGTPTPVCLKTLLV